MVKPTGPRLTLALVAIALVSYTFVLAPRLGLASRADPAEAGALPTAGASTPGVPAVFPPHNKSFIGVTTTEGTFNFAPVDAFTRATRHQSAVMMFSQGWAVHDFDRTAFDKVARRGMLPMLSWEPWNYRDDNVSKNGDHAAQPQYRSSRIAAGAFDDYVRSYAQGVKSLDYHVAIRFAHEMNGFWYPWGTNVNGNQTGDYVKMWRHVHDVFTSVGATNVTWVWSANVNFDNKTRLAALYPGDDYVDWIGLSGYYGTAGTQGYRSPDSIFDATLADLHTFSKRPIVITETAATDTAGLKAQWVRDFFQYLPKHADIIGFIWYEAVREADWRIASSQAASKAFAELAADPRYAVAWAPGLLPRTSVAVATPGPSQAPSGQPASPAPSRTNSTRPSPRGTRTPSRAPATPGNPRPTQTPSPPADPAPTDSPSP
ncbi:MAG TPA: glycosyl hydrolase [Planosporangium sp.]|nr:glycosyl hydrolase [Planosporangium sp.]